MKQIKIILLALVTLGYAAVSFAANSVSNSAVGYWQTVDDKSGKVLSVVQIYAAKDGTLSGKIYKIIPIMGQHPHDVCTACKGALHNKPIQGMTIIYNMQQDGPNKWIGGRALDPKSGSVYHARMQLIDDGCKLNLRGYIGIPLFGRTETWLRTQSKECSNQ